MRAEIWSRDMPTYIRTALRLLGIVMILGLVGSCGEDSSSTSPPPTDEFIIDRKNPRYHLSFGFGIHRCMGNRFGEMQLRILWEEILKRFSHVEVVGKPERVLSNFERGFSQLMVRLHPLD